MPNPLLTAFVEGLRGTAPFRSLPATGRPTEELWTAHNDTLLQLRLPLYYDRLRKPRPKQRVYDAAIQCGLGFLAAFAASTNTNQAIVRIERGCPEAISFQPRPHNANWTRPHGIAPIVLQSDAGDPLVQRDPVDGRSMLTADVSIRDVLHMAAKVAIAAAHVIEQRTLPSGTATFTFTRSEARPGARLVYRPLLAGLRHQSSRTIELAVVSV